MAKRHVHGEERYRYVKREAGALAGEYRELTYAFFSDGEVLKKHINVYAYEAELRRVASTWKLVITTLGNQELEEILQSKGFVKQPAKP